MFVDLHLHTTASDGTFAPEELVAAAKAKDFTAIAITDHDTLAGIVPAQREGQRLGLEVIEGVELSCELGSWEVHLLGYFIRKDDSRLLAKLDALAKARRSRGREMVGRLNRLGVSVSWERVSEFAGEGTVGRLHLARALVAGGWARDPQEAFNKFLQVGKPAYVPRAKLTPREAIELIHGAGGLAVLAHPKLINGDKLISQFKAQGLDGIEVYHTRHTPYDEAKYGSMAQELELLITGGSDCHGPGGKGEVLLGQVQLPYSYLEKLKEAQKEG